MGILQSLLVFVRAFWKAKLICRPKTWCSGNNSPPSFKETIPSDSTGPQQVQARGQASAAAPQPRG